MKEYDIVTIIWDDPKSNISNLISGILLKETKRHYQIVSHINLSNDSFYFYVVSKSSRASIRRYGKIMLPKQLRRGARRRHISKGAVSSNE